MLAGIRNIKLLLEYDGTDFHGWQIQKNARSVQGVLEAALGGLLGSSPRVVAASRTDAGAHARGQVVSFHTAKSLPVDRLVPALNSLLPDDVWVKEAAEVDSGFSARRSARSRRYAYTLAFGAPPLLRRYAWFIRRPVNLSLMEEASRAILGLKDFRAFSSMEEGKSCLCTVLECAWKERPGGYSLEIEADRFVAHMVRTLVGTMVRVGEGRIGVGEFAQAVVTRERPRLAYTAPARGLCLELVRY
ncbi:MAG: tRNA pseudouridine(38-40) synthase TruA [Candidatus Eisenbacteria bacterium]